MTTTDVRIGAVGAAEPAVVTRSGRMKALARAELTLLGRNKSSLFTVLVLPAMMTMSMYSGVRGIDLKDTGLTVGTVLLPGSLGFVLLFAVYSGLVGVYVVRREELVLKRLRTGELRDVEILTGAALPSVLIGLAQCVLLAVGSSIVMQVGAPRAVWFALVGLALGLVMTCALAAATAAFTKSAEGAQIAIMPMLLLSMAGSGMIVPLDVLPDQVATACELLPLTPVIGLIRAGWTGSPDAGEVLRMLSTVVAWTALSVFAVRSRFRWEPRR
ncbi:MULTISPECIES: ABC transporter permease [unclassified Streptomyces]|uniref:ABC transporter permease n=1 Tax=unclassified Streptomyces TaxID=2593676 RepID=UPI003821EC99